MAININTVYQKVLALANKEQRGYITPQEFNLLADKAQNEIYENYFHKARTSNAKIKDDDTYTDTLEMIEAKLAPFYNAPGNVTVTSGVVNLLNPINGVNTNTDIYKLISVKYNSTGTEYKTVTEVNRKEFDLITEANGQPGSVLYPTTNRPIYFRISGTQLSVLPMPTNGTDFKIAYYKTPTAPKWDYVVVNEKALYNSNTSVDFELVVSEEEPLVLRILMLAGLTIQRPDVTQAGGQGLQMINQEQNS
jgi:hypothetical protein